MFAEALTTAPHDNHTVLPAQPTFRRVHRDPIARASVLPDKK
jgi:hypothetical protein